jgi:hypothetical protein
LPLSLEAWRDGYAEPIRELTPFTPELAVEYFDQMIANIRDSRGFKQKGIRNLPGESRHNPKVGILPQIVEAAF